MRSALTVVLALLLVLGGSPPRASAEPVGGSDGATVRAQPAQLPTCTDLLGAGRWPEFGVTLAYEEGDVGPDGTWGRPRLCLLHYPREDVYAAVINGIDSPEQFRAARPEAIARIRAHGTDLCSVTKYLPWGTPAQAGYTDEDLLSLPVTCPPRVVAGDADAGQFLPTAREEVARAVQAITSEYGWTPDQPITTIVVSNVDSAAEVYLRYRQVLDTPQAAEAEARAGVSRLYTTLGNEVPYGNISLVNLSDPNQRTAATIGLEIQNAFGYFGVLRTIGRDLTITTGDGSNMPLWIRDGLVTRHNYRYALNGASGGYLVEAARALQGGTYPHLTELFDVQNTNTAIQRTDWFTVLARKYTAVLYMYDRFGADRMKQLLQASHNKTREDVGALLTELTGTQSVEGFEDAFNAWLRDRPRILAANPEGRIKVELLLYADGQRGEALVDETSAACTFNVRTGAANPAQPGIVGFSVVFGPDGSFTSVRPSTYVGNSVTLSGRLVNGRLTGTYQVVNEVTGCDGGLIPFGPA